MLGFAGSPAEIIETLKKHCDPLPNSGAYIITDLPKLAHALLSHTSGQVSSDELTRDLLALTNAPSVQDKVAQLSKKYRFVKR